MPRTLSRNLELIIGARDKFTGPLRKARAAFDRLKSIAGTAMLGIAAGFAAAQAAAVAFGKASVDAFAAFDTAMRDTWTLLGIGQEQFNALGDSILEMTQRVPQSPQQLGSAIYDIISAGVSETGDALMVLEQSALAATAGVTTTKDAAGAAVAIMNAFGKSTEDIPGIFDALFQTVNKGVVTFSELGPAAARTAASFKGAGGSIEDMLGTLAFLTKVVGNANESSTKLRATMGALTKAAPELKKSMDVAVFDMTGNFRGMEEVIGDLSKSLAGLTREEQLARIRKLFPEREAQDAIVAMVNNYDLLSSTLQGVAKNQGAMAAAAEKQMGSFSNQLQIMKNAFTSLKTGIGEIIAAVLGPELQGFTKWLQGMQDQLIRNKAAIIAFAGVIVPVLKTTFSTLVEIVKDSFAIAWGFVQEFWNQVQDSPRPILVVLGGLFLEIPQLLWTALQNAWEVVRSVAEIIFTPLLGALVWVGDQIRVWFQEKLKKPFVDFLNWAIEKSNKVREFFGQEPWELFPVETEVAKAETFEESWRTTFDVLKERFSSLGKTTKQALVDTVDDAVSRVKNLAGTLKGEFITPDLQSKLDTLQARLSAIPGALEDGYKEAQEAAKAAAQEAEVALEKVKAARAAAAAEPPPAPGAPGAPGDTDKKAKSFGEIFGQAFGAALGFAGGQAVASLVNTMFQAINSGDVSGFVNNFIDGAVNLIDGLVKGIPDFIEALVERMPDLITALIVAIPNLISELIMHIPDILSALGRGLVNLFEIGGRTIALAFITLVERLIGGLLRFLGIELRDDIERLQGEINEMTEALGRAEAPEQPPVGGAPAGTARDFARTAAPAATQGPVIIYNLDFAQPFVMADQNSMDQLARMLAEAEYRQARRSSGSTGTT